MTAELQTDFLTVEKKLSTPNDSELSEQHVESLKKRYFMYPHFIEGVATGRCRELTKEEIDKIVQENFFSFESLISLNQEQETLLRDQVTEHLVRVLRSERYQKLCGPILYD